MEKSIGAEVTFDADVADPAEIRRALLALSEKVGVRLRRAGQVGRTVSLKVRLADFRTVNRSRTLGVPTDVAREMFDTVWALYTASTPASGPAGRRTGGGARPRPGDAAAARPSARPSAAGGRRKLPPTPRLPVSGGPS